MTLFTVDGLIAAGPDPEPAGVASAVYQACGDGRDTIERIADELADRRIRGMLHG